MSSYPRVIRFPYRQFRYLIERLPAVTTELGDAINMDMESCVVSRVQEQELLDAVGDRLLQNGFGTDGKPNVDGEMLEALIDTITGSR